MASLHFKEASTSIDVSLIADVHLYGDAPKLCKFRPFVAAQERWTSMDGGRRAFPPRQ